MTRSFCAANLKPSPRGELETFLKDTQSTAEFTWVNRYKLDASANPPVYRFCMQGGAVPIVDQPALASGQR